VYCQSCGVDVPDANFCVSCGADLRSAGVGDVERTTVLPATSVMAQQRSTDAPGAVATVAEEPDDQSDDDPLVVCGTCRAHNSARRVLCAGCGAELGAGIVAPAPPLVPYRSADADEDTGDGLKVVHRHDPERTIWTAVTVVVVGLLLGAAIGVLIVLEVGPFSRIGDDETMPVFEESRYGAATDLTADAIGTRSTQSQGDSQSHAPANMLDGDLDTAWTNDGREVPDGEGEVVAVEFDEPVWLRQIVLANGAQRDSERYEANARLERVVLALGDGREVEVNLLDQLGFQSVTLDEPMLVDRVRIDVRDTFDGEGEDLSVSELRFRGNVADAADAASLSG
jgi:hypothetical protein